MKQAYGNWVDGDRFWDREADLELFIEHIDQGRHILLTAQRRMGKTSLMKEAVRRLDDKYICLFVDLQKSGSAADAMVELSLAVQPYRALWTKTTDLFKNILGKFTDNIEKVDLGELGIQLRAGLTEGKWTAKGDRLIEILAKPEKPVLVLFDEAPILVNRILKDGDGKITPERRQAADEFMSWLRHNSIRHQGKVRLVLSGSIGFEPVLAQAGLSATVNNFTPFDLKPWDEHTAIGCLDALAADYGVWFLNKAPSEMVGRLGCCIPHHVQMFFTKVYERCKRRGEMTFGPEEVDDVYNRDMLGLRGHAELTTYEERLKMVLGTTLFPLALEVLTEAAVTGSVGRDALTILSKLYQFEDRSTMETLREILLVLEHDGYLHLLDGRYVFVSTLLRDWWKKRYEAFFTPLSERGLA